MNIFGYVFMGEAQKGTVSPALFTKITNGIFSMIKDCNTQITSHPNLDLYASLQKACSAFQKSQSKGQQSRLDKQQYLQMVSSGMRMQKAPSSNRHNPFILEIEPCSKCFEAKSAPSRLLKLGEICKAGESKFTDSTIILKLNSTYRIDGFNFNLKEINGFKAIRSVVFYVNNL